MRAYRFVRLLVWALGIGVLCAIAASHADAQPSSNSRVNFVINGTVNTAARVGNTLYIGGAFNRIAPSTNAVGSLVAVNPSTAQVIPGRLPLVVGGDITTILPDGSGGYYIGGGFDRLGSDRQPNLRRIDASGQLVPAFVPSPGFVRALALAGGHLWVGGDFTFVSGQPRQRLAAIDPVTGAARAFATDANNTVFAIAVSGTRIIVAGSFTQIAGQARDRLAAFDATTGALLPWNPGADNTVNALAADATTVFVGGSFSMVGSVARARLAAVDAATGTTVATFAPPPMTNTVNKLLRHGPALYAGGNFAITGATPRNNAAAFSAVTGALSGWVPNINGGVTALAADGNLIYVGGNFSLVGGQTRTGNAAVDDASGAVTPWNPALIRGANAIEIASDGAVIVGGGANATGGVNRFNLAAIDMVSGNLLPFSPSTNGNVLAMAAVEFEDGDDDVGLLIGGNFTNVNGQPRGRFAVLDRDGDLDEFNPSANNTVNAIAVANGQVYVGGLFSTIAGQPRAGLASFSIEEEGALTDWAPAVMLGSTQGLVTTLEPGDGVMYVGGNYSTIGGATRTSLAAIDANSGTATAFDANLPAGTVLSLRRSSSTLYFGYGTIGLRVVDAATGAPTGPPLPALQPPSPVQAVAVEGNNLYVGGGLFTLGGVMRRGLGSIDLSPSPPAPTAWNPDAGYNVNAIYAYSDVVIAVGNFNRTNPVPAAGVGVWERTTGAPAPPLNFRAGAIDNLVSLQWTARALGPAATGYILEVGSTPTSGNDIATLPLGNVTSFSVNAPTATFYVRLRATNAAGQSEPTPTLRLDSGCTAPPGAPLGFSAFVNGNAVDLEWYRGQGNVARYILEVGSGSGRSDILTTSFPESQTTLSATAPPGTYFLRVKAANACGTGAPSSEIFFTIGSPETFPGSPENLTATVSGSNVSLSWTAPSSGSPPTRYVLEVGSANGLADLARIQLGPATTFSSGPVVPPGTYYVRVRAVNGAGIGPLSNGVVVVVR